MRRGQKEKIIILFISFSGVIVKLPRHTHVDFADKLFEGVRGATEPRLFTNKDINAAEEEKAQGCTTTTTITFIISTLL